MDEVNFMKLTGYEDLRVQRTINNIYKSFEELICEKEYPKITVKELAERAQINKKTFYRYYPTLDDLLHEMQAQYAKEYVKEVRDYHYPEDLDKSVASFFEFSAEQGEAYDKITISSGDSSYSGIRGQMINEVMNKTWGQSAAFNLMSEWQKQILFSFVESTGLNIYKAWVESGKKEPLEDVIKQAQALMRGGVTQYLKINNLG